MKTATFSSSLSSVSLEHWYEKRTFLILKILDPNPSFTQISAKKDVTLEDNAAYDVQTVLGKRNDPVLEALAMQLIQLIGETSSKPLMLSISLKPTSRPNGSISPEVFRAILKLVIDNRIW